jgi:hypothetical protein
MKSEILDRSAKLESIRLMSDFLATLRPTDSNFMESFVSPQCLLDEFDKLEQDNLRIVENLRHFQGLHDRSLVQISSDLAQNAAMTDEICGQLNALEIPAPQFLESPTADLQESEISRLSEIIGRAFQHCFKKGSDLSSLLQLQQIETQLERMYQQIALISPDFIRERQAMRDKERRDQQRAERIHVQQQEMKVKMAAARERANRPVTVRERRPLVPRTIPRPPEKKGKSKLEAMRRERARIDQLLYGDLFE